MARKDPTPAVRIGLPQARRIWFSQQRLHGGAAARDVPGGWMRNLAGIATYLAMAARCEDAAPATLEGLLADGTLWVVPGVRSCIWVVPQADVPLALRVAAGPYSKRTRRELEQAGVAPDELDTLGEVVCALLAERGPLRPHELRDELPADLVRSLGEAGKKRGHSTPLPAALRLLELSGRVRRFLVDAKLSTEQLAWGLPEADPLGLAPCPEDEAGLAEELAARYFRWAGPASLADFVAWSKLGKRVAKKAIAALGLVPVAVEQESAWMHPADLAALDALDQPSGVRLLSSLDNLHAHRSGVAVFCDPLHHGLEMPTMGSRTQPIGKLGWMWKRPMFEDGAWIGMWDWDPDAEKVATFPFAPLPKKRQKACADAAAAMTRQIKGSLDGDARMNTLDTAERQRKRIAFYRSWT